MLAPRELAPRLLLAGFAIAALMWLMVSLMDKRALDSANRVVAQGVRPTAAQIAQGLRDADRAARLHPGDTEPLIVKTKLLLSAGRPRAALVVAREVVRREPRNIQGWFDVALIASKIDPHLSSQAVSQIFRLDPVLRSLR